MSAQSRLESHPQTPGAGVADPDDAVRAVRKAAIQRARRRRLIVFMLRVAMGIALIGAWQLCAQSKLIDPFFYGEPSLIWNQLVTWVRDGTSVGSLWLNLAVTLKETVLGFLIGVVAGVIAGVALGSSRLLADILAPYIKALNSIPRIVLGSIFTIAFGLGSQSKIALAVVLVFFVVFFNAFQGVREVPPDVIANARILGASRFRLVREVILPSALTWILASLHTSFGFALVGAVVGEFLGSTHGVGLLISTAQNTFNANGVFAAMFILAVVALVAEGIISRLEAKLITWRPNPLTDISS